MLVYGELSSELKLMAKLKNDYLWEDHQKLHAKPQSLKGCLPVQYQISQPPIPPLPTNTTIYRPQLSTLDLSEVFDSTVSTTRKLFIKNMLEPCLWELLIFLFPENPS